MDKYTRALLAKLCPPGVLWHRPRGRKKWRKHSEHASVADAASELFAETDRGVTGDWKAIRKGVDPDAPDDDD